MEIDWLKHVARLNLPVYQYQSGSMKIAYAGYSTIKKNYYVRWVLESNDHHTFLGRQWFWQIPELIKHHDLDMVISEISPIVLTQFLKWNGYVVPEWITTRINIDRPISEICQRSVSDFSDVKRRIRKNNLTYEMLTGKESIDFFNDKFYLPYITKRHGEEAWIEDLSSIWESSPAPLLLGVKEDGVTVGASLIRKSGDSMYLLRLGLLDGNIEYRRHGVIGAIYYFSILEGQNMKCRYLDLGGTRPFLTDGLTKFKIGLGAEFGTHLSPSKEYLWIGVNEHSVAAEEFIKQNPVMHINKDFSVVRSGA